MRFEEPARLTLDGLRQFFTPPLGRPGVMSVEGVGVRELMPACMVERPQGTGDWLIMLFHDPAHMSDLPGNRRQEAPESLMIWPPGRPQYYGNPGARFSHSWIHCEGRHVREIVRQSGLRTRVPLAAAHAAFFQECLMEIHHELVSYTRPDMVVVENLLENALRKVRRGLEGGKEANRIPPALLEVRRLIGGAPAKEITLGKMAALAGMSMPHFCAQFKKHFGMPPVECLIRHRMHHAAHMLGNRQMGIAEIGEAAGYPDPFHFSKMFKKHFGLSPRAYRSRNYT
jgi:AraC-like DNA-binding protein